MHALVWLGTALPVPWLLPWLARDVVSGIVHTVAIAIGVLVVWTSPRRPAPSGAGRSAVTPPEDHRTG